MFVLAAADNWPASSAVLRESTSAETLADAVKFVPIHGPRSRATEPLPEVKLEMPLVLFPLFRMPDSRKFIWSATPVSEVSWNSGVVRPAAAITPGNWKFGQKKLNTVGARKGV